MPSAERNKAMSFVDYLIIGILLLIVAGAAYAIYRLGDALALRSAWVAWIPGGTLWVLGCVADEFTLQKKRWLGWLRWVLLAHWLLTLFMALVFYGMIPFSELFLAVADKFLLELILLSIIGMVAVYVALYRVYRHVCGWLGILFIVLGVLFWIPTPFCLLYTVKRWRRNLLLKT